MKSLNSSCLEFYHFISPQCLLFRIQLCMNESLCCGAMHEDNRIVQFTKFSHFTSFLMHSLSSNLNTLVVPCYFMFGKCIEFSNFSFILKLASISAVSSKQNGLVPIQVKIFQYFLKEVRSSSLNFNKMGGFSNLLLLYFLIQSVC